MAARKTPPAAPVEGDAPTETPAPTKGKKKPPLLAPGEVLPTLSLKERMAKVLSGEGMKALVKEHQTVMAPASTFKAAIPRIPMDIVSLDLGLGGGMPAGVMHHWFGNKASGKTLTLLLMIAKAQKLCSNCYQPHSESCCKEPRPMVCGFIDVEGALDFLWAKLLGVDMDALLYSRPNVGEEAADTLEALLDSGEVDLIGVDSLAALIPASEKGKAAGDADPASQARLVHRMMRKATSYLNEAGNRTGRRPTVIFLNQNRMKVGVVFGNPETQAGGSGPGYAASLELKFKTPKYLEDANDPSGKPIYVTINWAVEKFKLGVGKAEGEYRVMQRATDTMRKGEVMDHHLLIDLGVRAGLIEGSGSSWDCMGINYRGKSAIELKAMQDPALAAALRAAVLQVMLAD
jgi:recombination protein RecA